MIINANIVISFYYANENKKKPCKINYKVLKKDLKAVLMGSSISTFTYSIYVQMP